MAGNDECAGVRTRNATPKTRGLVWAWRQLGRAARRDTCLSRNCLRKPWTITAEGTETVNPRKPFMSVISISVRERVKEGVSPEGRGKAKITVTEVGWPQLQG